MQFAKPGCWLWAEFYRESAIDMTVRIWETDEKVSRPASIEILGQMLKGLHVAMGGDPDRAEQLVHAMNHTKIAMPGGVVQAVTIAPALADEARADDVYKEAVAFASEVFRKAVGAMGIVTITQDANGRDRIEIEYGPSAVFAASKSPIAKPDAPSGAAPQGRIVSLSATLRPSAAMSLGGKH